MDDMMGPSNVPPSMSMSLLTHHQNAASKLLQFQNDQNFFEGMLNNDSNMYHQFVSSSSSKSPELSGVVAAASGNNGMTSNTLFAPLKRALPGLFWNNDDDDGAGPSTSKRLQLDNGTTSSTDGNGSGSNSIATLLNQLPQTSTPSLHQHSMLGSLEDGLFRAMNWYS